MTKVQVSYLGGVLLGVGCLMFIFSILLAVSMIDNREGRRVLTFWLVVCLTILLATAVGGWFLVSAPVAS